MLKWKEGENMYVGLQNVNNAVDQINFNVDIDELFIRKIEFIMPTISFSVSSNKDLDYLKIKLIKLKMNLNLLMEFLKSL